LLVPRSKYDEAVEICKTSFENWKYGDPSVFENMQGPQINQTQQQRIIGLFDSARQQGATTVFGGGIPAHLEKGFFVEPTLFANVTNDMRIAQEEVFGPVLSVIAYDGDDEAVRIANDSTYGLSGGIHSADHERALAVARRIRTGTLSVNGGIWYGADAPFGGYKRSGIGRQCGIEGLEIFTETKLVGWPV
jgi:aldehyde dehydrogenase (NAD+)